MIDDYQKLKLEFYGIKDVITRYSDEGNISNFLNGLENALQEDDGERVLYYLSEICIWYTQNISQIHSNTYVYDVGEHDRNKRVLEDINLKLNNYDFSIIKKESSKQDNIPKIFLSHRSSDRKYGDALEKVIVGLGVKYEQLIYTTHPLHKIPLGENIYEFLRKNIHKNVFVIILWSNEYLESPACLNEMGAAWVARADYINIYTPDFSFGNPKYHECAVDTRKMGAVLKADAHCKASMTELKDKISEMFSLSINEQAWVFLLDQFVEDIR